MRVVFMGSPEFAVPSLQRLIGSHHHVVGVYTQPDRPVGRGKKPAAPPVMDVALRHGISVFQPKSISRPQSVEQMRELQPDIGVIAAYGQILKQAVLDVPRLGVINVHASLLPRWRGAAPIPAAILAGDSETGATIMQVVLALDAGPMIDRAVVPIAPDDTTATLTPRVAEAGARLLVDVLARYERGDVAGEPQDDALATYAPQIEKSDGMIRWEHDDAETIARQVRAYNPWPAAHTLLDGAPLRMMEARVHVSRTSEPPGTIVALDHGMAVTTRGLDLEILTLQPPGGRVMNAAAYLNGHRDVIGKRLSGYE
jgi:methionyl-tRNA formyltransferase